MKKKILTILLIVPLLGIAYSAVPMLTARAAEPIGKDKPKEIVIELAIPGMPQHNCEDAVNVDKNGVPKTCVADFTEYVSWFYRFFAGAVGMLAAVMILYGGYQWLTAGGNAGHVQQAKTTIYSSLIAIVLTLGTYLVLHTINPQLTNLTVRGVTKVPGIGERCSSMNRKLFPNEVDDNKGYFCGNEVTASNGATCIWDIDSVTPNNATTVCRLRSGKWEPTPVLSYCENEGYACTVVDSAIMQEKNSGDKDNWDKKFVNTGCGQLRSDNKNACRLNPLMYSYVSKGFSLPGAGDDYEVQPVNCFTTEAKDVCWKEDNQGRAVAEDCGGYTTPQPCTDITATSRAVVNTKGACLVKKPEKRKNGIGGTLDKHDFKCYNTPNIPQGYPWGGQW